MTSSFLENVKMYLFSQAMSRYCMIYFGYSPIKDFDFWSKLYKKKSDIKNLIYCYYFTDYPLTFKKKEINEVTRLIILWEGESYPTPTNFEDNSI